MNTFIVLIRGINVGGKNKVSMSDLKLHLEDSRYTDVSTYINSGNIVLRSIKSADDIKSEIESQLPIWFKLDSDKIKVLVIEKDIFALVVENKPEGFGEEPTKYHSDVIFLMNIDTNEAFTIFKPAPDVDCIWIGEGVVYSRRLSEKLTKSRLSKIMQSPLYQSMTIRNWNTTIKLYELIQ